MLFPDPGIPTIKMFNNFLEDFTDKIREDIDTFDSGINYLINITPSIAQFEQDIINERNL